MYQCNISSWNWQIRTECRLKRFHKIWLQFPHQSRVIHIVRCRYKEDDFLKNLHKRDFIACPLGWGMGCPLWIQLPISVLPKLLECCMRCPLVLYYVITALDCICHWWRRICQCEAYRIVTTNQQLMHCRLMEFYRFTLFNQLPLRVSHFMIDAPRSKGNWDVGLYNLHLVLSLQWRHNGRDCVSNHQSHDCLLSRLFRRRSKKTSKLRVTGLCAGNWSVTGEFPTQKASNAENVSIWWRHHVITQHKSGYGLLGVHRWRSLLRYFLMKE